MKYVFYNHYLLGPMHKNLDAITRAVVYEPKLELAQLYSKYLRQQEFETFICNSHHSLIQLNNTLSPHLIVYNIESGLEALKKVKGASPRLIIITIGDLSDSDVSSLMELGISGHINNQITHPRDVGVLAKQLLHY